LKSLVIFYTIRGIIVVQLIDDVDFSGCQD
jgi:hypothetical protein